MGTLPLERGLETLGALLAEEGQTADLVLIGGGALLLLGELERPTGDLDVVARVKDGVLEASHPFPKPLVTAVRRVGAALDLPHLPRDAKDWLNPGPSHLTTLGLPDGFENRLTVRTYGTLTIRIASRRDLVALKFFAVTDPQRIARRSVDLADIRRLSPTRNELLDALRWCKRVDGRSDFLQKDAARVLTELGIESASLFSELEQTVR